MIKYVEISSLSAPNANLHKAQQQKQKKKECEREKERRREREREGEREGEQFVVARAKHTRTYIDTDADTVGEIQLEMLGRCCMYICMYVYRRNRTYRYNRYLCCGG